MIVCDGSAALSALFTAGPARKVLSGGPIHVPHLIDVEVASGVRRLVAARKIKADAGWQALDTWRRLGVIRYPAVGLLERIWELRDNVSAYDATYIALAETLGLTLTTADHRLSNAPGARCAFTVVPR